MLRLIGILVGSTLAVAALIFMLGMPRLGSVSEPEISTQVIDPVSLVVPDIPDKAASSDPEPDGSETDPDLEAALVEQLFAPEASRELVVPDEPQAAIEARWYAFWSPFRSELAANGFVSKLQESTGIDYRVVKVKTGVYEVAFSYIDDADIEAKLERIAGATGLELSGS